MHQLFGVKFGENNIRSHVMFEISLSCIMLNVSSRTMLPDWTVNEIICGGGEYFAYNKVIWRIAEKCWLQRLEITL